MNAHTTLHKVEGRQPCSQTEPCPPFSLAQPGGTVSLASEPESQENPGGFPQTSGRKHRYAGQCRREAKPRGGQRVAGGTKVQAGKSGQDGEGTVLALSILTCV